MFLRKTSAKLLGAVAFAGVVLAATSASALPHPWQLDMQPAASGVMERIETFHTALVWIISAITLFVAGLMGWIIIRYRASANPIPSKTHHNTILEVAWTLIPVLILVSIAIPSFRLLYFEADMPHPDLTIEAIGKQWFWTYAYKSYGNFQFDSLGLSDEKAKAAGEPRLLGVDNVIVVPVNKVVQVLTTGADVIHAWTIPQFGVKIDAIPGRINSTWFKATQTGTFYGECSELCGARHSQMPIEVKVVPQAEFDAWVSNAKKKYAANAPATEFAAAQ
ncbi:MAG TPA: cytochrome c oxidase subunit II [Rhizomicrobium sp.]|jgi:cytochrome c oxidase subunit 2